MILAVDIGNTNIVFGLYENNPNNINLIHKFRIISDNKKNPDDYAIDIVEALINKRIYALTLSGCAIASVVPSLTDIIQIAISKFFAHKIYVIKQKDIKIKIDTNIKNKDEIGVDRLVNAYAGFREFGDNLIIVDFGTATTFDIVANSGIYMGGVIAPGINLSLRALHEMTAKLPKIYIHKQKNVVSKNTSEAMNSGVYYGYISLCEGIIKRIESELQIQTKTIVTGGLSEIFKNELNIESQKNDLTIDGIKIIYDQNINNQKNNLNGF